MKKILIFVFLLLVSFLTFCMLVIAMQTLKQSNEIDPGERVIFSSLGGLTKEITDSTWGPSFYNQYGCKVIYVAKGASTDVLSLIIAQKDNPQIDVVAMDEGPGREGQLLGLWEPLDVSLVPNLEKLYDLGRIPNDEGALGWSYALGVAYNSKVFAENNWEAPTKWTDLLRPELRNHIVMPHMSTSFGPLTLLKFAELNGGDYDNIEPGMEVFRELAPYILSWEKTYSRVGELFQSGDAYITIWSNLGTYVLQDQGFPIKWVLPEDGTWVQCEYVAVVKNSPNPVGAQLFLNYLLGEEAQSYRAKVSNYGPLNKEVVLPVEVAERAIYGQDDIDKLQPVDWKKFNELRAQWADYVSREIEVIELK